MSASNGNPGTANGNIFINSANVYPGAVFPKPSIDSYAFDAEIRYDKSPYDLNFMFPMPYSIEDIDSSKGLSNYNKKISEALNSTNFTNYINSGYKKEVDYSATEVYNYEDVKKAFSFNTKLGGLFSTKMTENKHNQKYSSIYFARLVSTSFDVIFDQNRDGFSNQVKLIKTYKMQDQEVQVVEEMDLDHQMELQVSTLQVVNLILLNKCHMGNLPT